MVRVPKWVAWTFLAILSLGIVGIVIEANELNNQMILRNK